MSRKPEPTPDGYGWRCGMCEWTGAGLMDAKAHSLEMSADPEMPFDHFPFEAPIGKSGVMSQLARRIMLPADEPDTVSVSSWSSAKRRFNDVTKPLVESLRSRGGRLRHG